jgi:hypothetical protein
MSATSSSYWKAVEGIKEELQGLATMGDEAYASLESEDDPRLTAECLVKVHDRLLTLEPRVSQTIPALQEVAKAFDSIAAIK